MGGVANKTFQTLQISQTPIAVHGLVYPVTIYDTHMQIGNCETHTFQKWSEFTDDEIKKMDPESAPAFWTKYKKLLLGLAMASGRWTP